MSLVTLFSRPIARNGQRALCKTRSNQGGKRRSCNRGNQSSRKEPGYMDDFLLFLHAGPIVGVFFPQTRAHTMEGIEALSALPEWYLAVWFTMIAGVWGAPKLADLSYEEMIKAKTEQEICDIAWQYAEGVVKGEYRHVENIKLSCQRSALTMRECTDITFDPAAVSDRSSLQIY